MDAQVTATPLPFARSSRNCRFEGADGGGSNWVEADRPDVAPVAVTVYSPPTVAPSVNW